MFVGVLALLAIQSDSNLRSPVYLDCDVSGMSWHLALSEQAKSVEASYADTRPVVYEALFGAEIVEWSDNSIADWPQKFTVNRVSLEFTRVLKMVGEPKPIVSVGICKKVVGRVRAF